MIDPNQKHSVHPVTGRLHVETVNNEPSMTQQQFKDECDINNIVKKYNETGQFTHMTSKQGAYSDFSQITDYKEMLETVRYADEAFSNLPATIRARFANDPGQLLTFLQDDSNYDEGVSLGLVKKRDLPIPPTQTQTQTQTPPSKPPRDLTKSSTTNPES